MNKSIAILLILSLYFVKYTNGQDMQFSQFYSSSIYLNPAFAGANVCSRVSTIYRNQFTGLSEGYSSTLVSFDHYISSQNIGIGLQVGRDYAGTGNLSTTIINPVIAYETKVNRKLGLRFGIQPGVAKSSVSFDNLTFGDQIARGGDVATIEEFPDDFYYFDFAAGILAYAKQYWIGLSFHHINSPTNSFYGNEESVLPIKYSLHGGHKFLINDLEEENISIAFNYRAQEKFDQLEIGGYYTKDILNIGIWYRGIPWFKAFDKGFSNNESIAIVLGLKTDIMSIGYSYDLTVSKLNLSNTHGSHEISLSYQFCNLKNQKKRRIFVDCPSF